MRTINLTMACLCAVLIGLGLAVEKVTQPVGFVTEQHCVRPDKPCVSYDIKIQIAKIQEEKTT